MTSIQEYECVFCKESFDKKEALQIHFRKHADPNFNPNKGRIQSASPSLDSSREGVELVSCDVCPEMFPTISKAITHKHKVHPEHDAKYFCPWCGKLFTMKHLYNKHMQANHSNQDKTDEKSFHCDCCNVDFHTPAAVLYHNKFFHRQDTDIPPFGQSKKLKMYNQEVIPIYYCSFCGEEYENKVNLHKHAVDDHSDENQSPDVVMRCPLCDAIFYHLDAYELHLTFHTSEDLYSERSEMADDVSEYSLESVPPIMEKVENCELQQDAETTMKEVGIEVFLEQALEEPESVIMKKNKKHKKHKKSKKSAITLDEFLNMNKDVFGEGLDFQGVEEVPTQVITKKFKVAKKPPIISSAIAPELEKLRKHGIVIKKKPGHGIPIPNKIPINKSLKPTQRIIANKAHCEPKVSTSVDTLDKLINNTSNQIKIVKNSNKNNCSKNENTSNNINDNMDNYEMECDSTKKDIGEHPIKDSSSHDESIPAESSSNLHEVTESKDNDSLTKSDIHESNDDVNLKSEETKNESNAELVSLKPLRNSNPTTVESSTNNDNNDDINDVDNMGKTFDQDSADSNTSDTTSETTNKGGSLTSLKHLSHLITVKPVLTNKTSATLDSSLNKNEPAMDDVGLLPLAKDIVSASDLKNHESQNDFLPSTEKIVPEKSLSVQIKSNSINYKGSASQEDNFENDIKKSSNVKSIISKPNLVKNVKSKNLDLIQSQHISTNTGKNASNISEVKYNNKQETTNLLKHLTGITAKPISVTKSFNKLNNSMPTKNTIPKNVTKIIPQREQVNDDDIEIFSIDDSDDEIDSSSQNNNFNINNPTQPRDVLKNLSKNITVRSVNTPENTPENNKIGATECQNDIKSNDQNNLAIDEKCVKYDTNKGEMSNKKGVPKVVTEKDSALKFALKNLSKNITVKSRNSSPSHTAKSKDQNVNYEDFNDEPLTRVKITELHDDEDNDALETDFENKDNIVVESPEDSQSDKDLNEEMDMEDDDFENQIKANMLKKDECIKSPESDPGASGISGTSKDKINHLPDDSDEDNESFEGNPALEITKNLGKQISIRPLKSIRKGMNQKNISNAEESLGQSTSHSVTNQRMSTSNQVNTVNKEVTVKTFQTQTKTVVQEITTTVTKTIKTVNQTVKQEVRNVSNYGSTSKLPQKVQGMKVQQSKNLQGIVVRHSSPLVRPKIRNTPPGKSAVGTTVRQSNPVIPLGTSVRPSNQIVPIRPRSNVGGVSNPRMPCVPKIRPSTSNQTASKITRPLKVSPEALILPSKRPNVEETSGPFSCFKKPKESLIPVSDVTTLNSNDIESISEYTSLSKSSSMNMVSTSKGKSVTTSTQMKSEMSASSHHLGGINNVSGIKMTKTSQCKQVQVHENNEVNTVNRTTLEAIQKLQKQGLLVKKPRLDINNSEDSNNSDDNNSTDNDI